MKRFYPLLVFCIFLFLDTHAFAESRRPSKLAKALDPFIASVEKKYGTKLSLGVLVTEAQNGKLLYSRNADRLFIPASVLKIIPSVAMLKWFGTAYTLPTEIFVDRLPQEILHENLSRTEVGNVGALYVRGYGDPSLVSESLAELAKQLASDGVKIVEQIVIDDSLFINPTPPKGDNPYEAGYSATSVNFNSYALTVTPSVPGRPALLSVTAGTPMSIAGSVQTVLGEKKNIVFGQQGGSPSGKGKAQAVTKGGGEIVTRGKLTVKGEIGAQLTPQVFYIACKDPSANFGGVLKESLVNAGILVRSGYRIGITSDNAKRLRVYKSKTLDLILRDLNQYSSNFISGQLLFAMGQNNDGYFEHSLGLQKLRGFLGELDIKPTSYSIVDASGLDRGNRFTARQLATVLLYGYQDFSISPVFVASLSHFGHSGTLEKRKLALGSRNTGSKLLETRTEDLIWAKTGTLNGVSSLVGFLQKRNGNIAAFVILVNGDVSKDVAIEIEDKILSIVLTN